MATYVTESFTDEESAVLRRYFTNLDLPVFALVNLPEVVKGALFARYSRTSKSLRRLFLDEFVNDLDLTGDVTVDATVGVDRAEKLYEKVFNEYGDDSVAQLGGVHLACEQASNILTKQLEWGRLAAYLEQSTRYIAYDTRMTNGLYRYYRPQEILESSLGARYVGDMDRIFDAYGEMLPAMISQLSEMYPKAESDSDFVYRQTIRAKALDSIRGLLPAATLSNLGMFGTGQAYEQLIMRLKAHPLPESHQYADMILTELRKVIPSFLARVDRPDRGVAWADYMRDNREAMSAIAEQLLSGQEPAPTQRVTLTDFDPEGEDKMIAAMLYSVSHLSEMQLLARVQAMSEDDKSAIVRAYVGDRTNRRHKPGRALERTSYRFDVLSDYGAFRDLQRHRLLTIEWQDLSPHHGYAIPSSVLDAGLSDDYAETMDRAAELHDVLADSFGAQSMYAVSLGYKMRYVMHLNARAAMHMLELRTAQQGHPEYRQICQEMHTLIGQKAGHHHVAQMMKYVDHNDYELERLESERRLEAKRTTSA
jgi:thymidylate synthase ThyX